MSDDELAFKASYHNDAARCFFPFFCVNFKSTHISYMFIFPTYKLSDFLQHCNLQELGACEFRLGLVRLSVRAQGC